VDLRRQTPTGRVSHNELRARALGDSLAASGKDRDGWAWSKGTSSGWCPRRNV
jgi:hypothetical protein